MSAHNPITLECRFDKKVWSIRHRSRLLSNQIESASTLQPHDGLVFCGFYEALGIFLPLIGDGEIIEENCIDRKMSMLIFGAFVFSAVTKGSRGFKAFFFVFADNGAHDTTIIISITNRRMRVKRFPD